MKKQVSPFAALTGAEKQIRWMEYQSIRLPYVETQNMDQAEAEKAEEKELEKALQPTVERPQPPPEVPRIIHEFQRTRHSQYDAVIARMKQAELQSRRSVSQTAQQSH